MSYLTTIEQAKLAWRECESVNYRNLLHIMPGLVGYLASRKSERENDIGLISSSALLDLETHQ